MAAESPGMVGITIKVKGRRARNILKPLSLFRHFAGSKKSARPALVPAIYIADSRLAAKSS